MFFYWRLLWGSSRVLGDGPAGEGKENGGLNGRIYKIGDKPLPLSSKVNIQVLLPKAVLEKGERV